MQVIAGSAEIGASETNKLTIQSGDHTILQWDHFSIGKNEIAQFLQLGENSALLNRVMGGSVSEILGLMESNGKLYLINPNGVLIGPDARIESAGFLASTLDVLNEEFLAKQELLFTGDSKGAILNLGTISCPRGDVALFARFVKNEGNIQAKEGSALLATAPEILLKPEGKQRIYIRPDLVESESREEGVFPLDSTGTIEALSVELQSGASPYLQAIRGAGSIKGVGTVEENGIVYLVAQQGYTEMSGSIAAKRGEKGGEVRILGDKVTVLEGSKIDATGEAGGGTVLIGGSFQGKDSDVKAAKVTMVGERVEIAVDALSSGNGGQVVLWSKNATAFFGSITAQGGPFGGDGGNVEVSGPNLFYRGKSSTLAALGKTGTLLLDPNTITISTTNPSNPAFNDSQYYDGVGTAAANIFNTELEGNLAVSNVVIQTSDTTGGGTGDIIVTADVIWNAPTQLTMLASNQLLINTPGVTISNTFVGGTGTFTAMNFMANQQNLLANGAGILIQDCIVSSSQGDIFLTGTGGNNVGNNIGVDILALTMATQVTVGGAGSIFINGRATSDVTGAVSSNFGVYIHGMSPNIGLVSANSGNIVVTGTAENSSALMITDNIGVFIDTAGQVRSIGLHTTSQIVIEGIGGPGTGSGNDGIRVSGTDALVSTEVGNISLIGTGNGTGITTNGILISNTAAVTSVEDLDTGTTISLLGNVQGRCNGSGIRIEDASVSSVSSSILMSGTGGFVGANNVGVEVFANTIATSVSAFNGSVTINGKATPDFTMATSGNSGVRIHGNVVAGVPVLVTVQSGFDNIAIIGDCQAITAMAMTTSNVGVLIDTNGLVSSFSPIPTNIISIQGTGGPGSGGQNNGIQISSDSSVSTDLGNISLVGLGNGTGSNNYGIFIANDSTVVSLNMGATGSVLSLEGIGSNGINGATPTDFNCGVSIQNALNGVTSVDSNISIVGTGGANATGTDNHGIYIGNIPTLTLPSSITATGVANISLTGFGGGGSSNCAGVTIQDVDASVTPSSVESANGNIAIFGKAIGNSSSGVSLSATGLVTSLGDIEISGFAYGGGNFSHGISVVNSAIISTTPLLGRGLTTLSGRSSPAGGNSNVGVFFSLSIPNVVTVNGLLQTFGSHVVINGISPGARAGINDNIGIQIINTSPASLIIGIPTGSTGFASMTLFGEGGIGFSRNHGVSISGNAGAQTLIQLDHGDLSITGFGGGGVLGNSNGIQIASNSSITSNTGNQTFYGEGSSLAAGSSNMGILISDSSINSVSAGKGILSLTGIGSEVGVDSNIGIQLTGATTFSSIQSLEHDIYVTATGGGTGDNNTGLLMDTGSEIRSTGMASTAAAIYVEGTGGTATNSNIGVLLVDSPALTGIRSNFGDISIIGIGNGSGTDNYGIQLTGQSTIAAFGAAPSSNRIFINGKGSVFGTALNRGVYQLGVGAGVPSITSVQQPITIVAESGLGTNEAYTVDHGSIFIGTDATLNIKTLSFDANGGDLFLQNVSNVRATSPGTSHMEAIVARDFQMIDGGGMIANSLNIEVGRDIIINGGGGTGASVGVCGLQTAITNGSANPLTLEVDAGRDITMTGGPAMGQGAIFFNLNGDSIINVGGNLSLQAGAGTNAFAQIGGFFGTGNLLFPLIGGDVTIVGDAWASIGYGNPIASFSGANITGNITFQQINGNVVLRGGPVAGGFAQIGHINPPAGPAFAIGGNIFINALGSIIFNDVNAVAGTFAQIGHGPLVGVGTFTAAAAVQVFAGNTINMAGIAGSQAIITNLSTNPSATFPHSGSITLVADNNNPLNPYVGGTSFSMNSTSTISNNMAASGGQVRLYTSLQDTTAAGIPAGQMINGAAYSPTPPGTNSTQELFNLYYGAGQYNVSQFVIYYKLPIVINPVCPVCPICPICPVCPVCPKCPSGGNCPSTTVIFFPQLYIIAVATAQLTDLLPVLAAADHHGQVCIQSAKSDNPGQLECSPGFSRFESFVFENTVDRILPLPKD